MSSDPLVTIWIPSYNHARFLPEAIESLRRQTYHALEIVVVDDGSTDGSLDIAEDFAARDERIRVYTHRGHANRGISETANACFSHAHGVFVGGLPSDDVLYPDSVERRVAALEAAEGAAFAYGTVAMLTEEGEPTGATIGVGPATMARLEGSEDPLETLLLHNYIPGMSQLYRRSALERFGLLDPNLVHSDWEHGIRLVASADSAFVGGEPVAGQRRHARSTSLAAAPRTDMERSRAMFAVLESKVDAIGGRFREPRMRALVSLQIAWHAWAVDRERDAAAAVRRAFAVDPALADDRRYLLWWLRSKARGVGATFSGYAQPDADWFRHGVGRPRRPLGAILAGGAQARHFGCWFAQTAIAAVEARGIRELAWDVLADERESTNGRRRSVPLFIACLLRALADPRLLRVRGFGRVALDSVSLLPSLQALRDRVSGLRRRVS